MLRQQGHTVCVVDLIERLVTNRGDLELTLDQYAEGIRRFRPDILGIGFFSIHYIEVQKLVRFSRRVCERAGIRTTFIAGGIHASTEPSLTLTNLEFDYVVVGEAEMSLPKFCGGADPNTIPGVIGASTPKTIGLAIVGIVALVCATAPAPSAEQQHAPHGRDGCGRASNPAKRRRQHVRHASQEPLAGIVDLQVTEHARKR